MNLAPESELSRSAGELDAGPVRVARESLGENYRLSQETRKPFISSVWLLFTNIVLLGDR